jgi:hypothetical protein
VAAAVGALATYVGSFFTAADATAAGLAGAAAAGAGADVAASGSPSGGTTPPRSFSKIAKTVSEASAIASGASSIYTLAAGAGNVNVPPAPNTQAQTDQSVASAEQLALRRERVAGGMQCTIGTGGGTGSQAGAVLDPATLSSKSLLGS